MQLIFDNLNIFTNNLHKKDNDRRPIINLLIFMSSKSYIITYNEAWRHVIIPSRITKHTAVI